MEELKEDFKTLAENIEELIDFKNKLIEEYESSHSYEDNQFFRMAMHEGTDFLVYHYFNNVLD